MLEVLRITGTGIRFQKTALIPEMNGVNVDILLSDFPRKRPQMPPAQQDIYEQEYRDNRTGRHITQNLSQRLEAWMHRCVAAEPRQGEILEIGAGTLNHLQYENTEAYDVVEPFEALYKDRPEKRQIRQFFADITEVPLDTRYRRIISIAVLEHLLDLPVCLARSGLLLGEDGVFQAGIPSEGGMLWGLGWRCTTGLAYRLRTGLSYTSCMRHEHVNTAPEIVSLVRYFFSDVRLQYFPLAHHHLSLYVDIHAVGPKLDLCRSYLHSRGLCTGHTVS